MVREAVEERQEDLLIQIIIVKLSFVNAQDGSDECDMIERHFQNTGLRKAIGDALKKPGGCFS
jgi:hypothetical protein